MLKTAGIRHCFLCLQETLTGGLGQGDYVLPIAPLGRLGLSWLYQGPPCSAGASPGCLGAGIGIFPRCQCHLP